MMKTMVGFVACGFSMGMFCMDGLAAEVKGSQVVPLAGVVSMARAETLPKGSKFSVKKAKFHSFEKLRAGRIKTEQGWNVADFAMSIYNPSSTNGIKVTWSLIADDPNFVYKNGQTGTWTKVFMLARDNGKCDNVYSGAAPDQKWPVSEESNWTGKSEFSSDVPFYVYILPSKIVVEGPVVLNAGRKAWLLWADEVQGVWDEDRKQQVFPYTNFWQNDPYWLGGWHTRLIVVNKSDAPVVLEVSHKPYYWIRYNAVNKWERVPFNEQFSEITLAAGETKDVWLEEIFGWSKDLPQAMEGRLCMTTAPESAREKCEVKLYVLPDKVRIESLKEAEKQALSEDVGVVVSDS